MKKKILLWLVLLLLILAVCACNSGSEELLQSTTAPTKLPTSQNIPSTVPSTLPTTIPTTVPTNMPTTAVTTVPTTRLTTRPTRATTKAPTASAPPVSKPPLLPIVKPTGPAYVYEDERAEMIDSKIFRALKYLGYDRAGELEHKGLLFTPGYTGIELQETYEAGKLENYPLTQIFYANGAYGTATRPAKPGEKSKTGNVPDVDLYVKKGLVCTGFVDYYFFAYLRNIEGVKVGHIISAFNKTNDKVVYEGWVVDHWTKTAELLAEQGQATVYRFDFADSQPPVEGEEPSEGFIRYEEMFETLPIGALIRIGRENNRNTHFAVYAGTFNGIHYMIHMGSNRGPEIVPIAHSFREEREQKAYPLAFYVIEGVCETAG